ncbi:hypothetical protein F4810DRAFT_675097 [Camillea tinctor]|nr:hypothetical protein F4810DRAFT_675097 [Camillea tinctor]
MDGGGSLVGAWPHPLLISFAGKNGLVRALAYPGFGSRLACSLIYLKLFLSILLCYYIWLGYAWHLDWHLEQLGVTM